MTMTTLIFLSPSLLLLLVAVLTCDAFVVPPRTATEGSSRHATTKQWDESMFFTTDTVAPIDVGDELPDVDIEVLKVMEGKVESVPESIRDVVGGPSKSVLVGMPGAFTPTCSELHMPGLINAIPKLEKLGVNKIGVVTQNDRFVNQAWANQFKLLETSKDDDDATTQSSISIICDADGKLAQKMGMLEDLGFGLGKRSKRFALILDESSKVKHVLVESETMDECQLTSAENLIVTLTKERKQAAVTKKVDSSGPSIGVFFGAAILAAAAAFIVTSLDSPPPLPSLPELPSLPDLPSMPSMPEVDLGSLSGALKDVESSL